jgi:hypothetical protein
VQRVLVDGLTPEEAGAPFGVDGQSVARWVAAYRHHGMAALRAEAVATGPLRWIEACLRWIGWAWAGVPPRGGIRGAKPPFARSPDRDGAPRDPTRRWRSY